MATTALTDFQHRGDYASARGAERWTVRHVGDWVARTLPGVLARTRGGAVLDAGCGEQPFRRLIEHCGHRYVGMDAIQNSGSTVEIISDLEHAPASPFPVVLCTEVLEHVADVDAAFAGLRRVCAPRGAVVLTVPFVYPMHMEPFDFRRLTRYGVERLAAQHGFTIESFACLGTGGDVLATLLADLSVLPTTDSLAARGKVRALRALKILCIKALDSSWLCHNVSFNANLYLTNGFVLRSL